MFQVVLKFWEIEFQYASFLEIRWNWPVRNRNCLVDLGVYANSGTLAGSSVRIDYNNKWNIIFQGSSGRIKILGSVTDSR